MVTRLRLVFPALGLALVGLITLSCSKVPLLAPSGSTITLLASTTALPVNGTTPIIAQVIEASGTPPQAGTQVTFSTTLGTIEPASVDTDSGGRATATFKAGTANGTAQITAISGGASVSATNAIKIAVGTAAVGRVTVTANPTLLPSIGGTTAIAASIIDINGNPLTGAPVSFVTTAGLLGAVTVTTDGNGVAATTLQTVVTATVTATVGATSPGTPTTGSTTPPATGPTVGTVTVNIAGAPTLLITPPSTAPTAGVAGTYTFAVTAATTNGSTIRDVTVNWGDGSTKDLGAVIGTSSVSHTYNAPGTYNITGTVTDASGNQVTSSTAVTVNAKLQPTVSLTAPTTTPTAGVDTTFTASVAAAANSGAVIQDVVINFGDGNSQDLGATTGPSISIHHVFNPPVPPGSGTYVQTLTATDTNGGVGTATTSVFVQAATPLGVTLSASSSTGTTTTTVTFTATVTGLGNAVAQSYLWDFCGTGGVCPNAPQTTTSNQITVQYPHGAITYTPSVKVTASDGRTATGNTSITP